jgi:cytochrome b involved in lipid metabolism
MSSFTPKKTKPSPSEMFTPEQVSAHEKDEWLIIDDCVYDLKSFDHPGGVQFSHGQDSSKLFHETHSEEHLRKLDAFRVGGIKKKSSL